MKRLAFFRTLLLVFLLFVSLIVNLGLGYYQFGNWENLPEWDFKLLGYRVTSGQKLFQSQVSFSKLNQLSGQYEDLATISKEINQQFYQLQSEIRAIEGTAEATRETISNTLKQLTSLEASMVEQQAALVSREAELKTKENDLAEATKTIKNQQRQLRASSVIRMDNDAYILQYEFTRLSRILEELGDESRFIQTSLRKGIISIPVSQFFEDADPTELTTVATNFLYTFAYSMDHLPNATLDIVQFQSSATRSSDTLYSAYSANIALTLINNGMAPSRILVASQPTELTSDNEPLRIELRISI